MTNSTTAKRHPRMARQPNSGAQEIQRASAAEHVQPVPTGSAKKPNKTDAVLALLQSPDGATLDELVAATGWLPHSTRAELTGLKKKGYVICRIKADSASRYSIVRAVAQ